MTTKNLILNIQRAKKLSDVLNVSHLKKEYRLVVKLLHPDLCSHNLNEAVEALIKLNQLKEAFFQGALLNDDAGIFRATDKMLFFSGKKSWLQRSYNNYFVLKNIRIRAALHFHQYLPETMNLEGDLKVYLTKRAIPISGLELPQKHVNWILSRLLEVVAWLSQEGYVHAGIHPESILVVPETHGIVLTSFYHLTQKNQRLKSISATYQHWYPEEVFWKKQAIPLIDIELCKRTAAYLLGDKSGIGVSLKKTHHIAFINFLLKRHTNAYHCYDEYRSLLDENFEKKFWPLEI